MKKTPVLFKHNISRMTRFNWYIQGKIKVIPTKTEAMLKRQGITVTDINELLYPPREKREEVKYIGLYDREIPKDENHPDYKKEPCYMYRNENVLIEGLEQAKILTNTVEVCEGLPNTLLENEQNLNVSDEIHTEVTQKIKLSCMLNAMQEKLPRKKDPNKLTWVFAREYGITQSKKCELLCTNLTTVCEKFAKNTINKSVILDAFFSTPIAAHNKKIQFETTSEMVVTTGKKLTPLAEPSSTYDIAIPDLYPMLCTASLSPAHFYNMEDIYPINVNSRWPYVQIAFLHLIYTQVKNAIEEELTESQIIGRSLLKGFNIAVAQARAVFGNEVKELPEPVVVPVVQTDGKLFQFSIFQLNTLELDTNSEVKNIFWNSEKIPLYSLCEYKGGRPTLEGYNPDVIRRLITFYDID